MAPELLFVIAGRVDIVAIGEDGRGIIHHGGWGEDRLLAGDGIVNRSRIDKGLENGAGGTLGNRMVQLAGTVVAPAYQGQYLAGVGINRKSTLLNSSHLTN